MYRLSRILVPGLFAAALAAQPVAAAQHPNHVQGFQPERLYQFGNLDHVNLFNGNLTVQLPLGDSYPVGGGLSYQLTLTYTGNVWEYETVRDPVDGHDKLMAVPRKKSNAGLGWRLSLGALEDGYLSPDGAHHPLSSTLHPGGATATGYTYSKDSTYLRLNSNVSPKVLEFPDGTRRYFDGAGLLTKIDDRFGNSLSVTYPTSTTYSNLKDWKLTDSQGRVHWIHFKPAPAYGGVYSKGVVDRVVVRAFNGNTATYTFNYSAIQVTRGLTDSSLSCLVASTTETVPMLTSVSRPDGTQFSFAYDPGPYHSPCQDGSGNLAQTNSTSGHLVRMTLPTRGSLEWVWQYYLFPKQSERLGPVYVIPPAFFGPITPFSTSAGVIERRMVNAGDTTQGLWTYQHGLTPDALGIVKEATTLVTDPLGHQTTHYFSAYACRPEHQPECPSQDPDPGGWSYHDYGLPFTRLTTDGSGTRFLSSEIRNFHDKDPVTGQPKVHRRTYVRYESSGFGYNPRVASERTVFVKDGSRYADIDSSGFDGLGHYRQVATGGNFGAGDVRTTFTNYNPGSCATCTPSTSAAWVLETYNHQTVTEGGVTAKTEACFEAGTGFLLRTRSLKTGTTQGATDLVTRYTKGTSGNVTAEEYFGGDTQSLGTGSLCGLALPTPKYKIDHTYQYGSLKTSQYSGQTFKLADFDIDQNTGRIKTSRDGCDSISCLSTTYEYDALGRLTWMKPSQEGWTQYSYTNASGSSTPAKAFVYRKSNGGGTVLDQEEVHFDPFGRVAVERRKMADGSFQARTTSYNGAGHVSSRTEWGTTSATSYFTYDPFGRPGKIRPPDGSTHDVILTYAGVRQVVRNVKVGTYWNGTSVTEEQVTTTETYDRQGRLYQVSEPSNPDGSPSTTTYAYDVGGRLKQVTQTAQDGTGTNRTQTRKLNYDNRGFLTSEQHPEKGVSGNGFVYYYSYDARGHAGRVLDGPSDLTFTYDSAERVTRIRETGSGFSACSTTWSSGPHCLKEFTYGTSNGTGDYRLGKLQVAKRYNYPVLGTTTYTAVVNQTYTYGGKQGRPSARETSLTFNGTTTERFPQTWTWNDLGQVASIGYPQCNFAACTATVPRTVGSTYTHGFLTGVTGYTSSINYHPNGQVNQVTRANGVIDTYSKDPYNILRPNKIDAKYGTTVVWNSGVHAYDGAGNMTKAGNAYFAYDRASRVQDGRLYLGAGAGGTAVTFDHAYDGFGNLLSLTTNSTSRPTPTSYATNRLTGSVTYDAAGNLISWNGNTYQYDRFHQMTRVASGTEIWLYMYDADDERFWAFKEGANPRFDRFVLRDLDGKVLRTYEVGGTGWTWSWKEDHVYRGTTLLASVTPSGTTHLHTDHLGTPRAHTNSSGTRVDYHVYYPFGEEATAVNQNAQRMKFTGHERDLGVATSQADDLDYMHARFYNPQTGRFLSFDAAGASAKPGAPQTWNRYSYVGSNPLKYVDPDGNERAAVMQDVAVSQLLSGEISTQEYTETLTRPGPAAVVAAGAAGVMGLPALAGSSLSGASGTALRFASGHGLLVRATPAVSSPALANVVNQLFKVGDRFPGGTANAIRIELATGQGVAGRIHIQAGLQRLKGLQDLLKGGGLSGADTSTAMKLTRDLQTSLQPLLSRLGMTADQLRTALSSGKISQEQLLKLMKE